MPSQHAPIVARTDFVTIIVGGLIFSFAALAASAIGARAFSAIAGLGPLSAHMIEHMALIGIAAPVSAYALQSIPIVWNGARLTLAAVAQITLLWIWHLPPVFSLAGDSAVLHLVMSGSLYVAGVLFWGAVLGTAAASRWQGVVALLMTGKLFCLFAAILVFSPRLLYDLGAHAHQGGGGGIEDQQLAGLIMITVCPLTYVAAGIAMAARWFMSLEEDDRAARIASAARLRSAAPYVVVPFTTLLGGCEGVQSALAPASPQAKAAFDLTLVLFIGGTIIFVIVMTALAVALLGGNGGRAHVGDPRIVVYGGIIFPIAVLTPLLGYGLWLKRDQAMASAVREITVQGERWWWRVTYGEESGGNTVTGANELRLEAGRPVRIKLTSSDVIHSFWVPALAGKVDMIPGRENELVFTPTKPGTYRGQCAEYCGGAHALMGLRVIVMDTQAYAEWRAGFEQPAGTPADPLAVRGQELFEASCVACHAVRGTSAAGRLGPDLTHLASRHAIAAETLPMSRENLALWLTDNEKLKPGNLMPEYADMPPGDLDALTAYLTSLK
jgi:cytochrome c oxidase subunit II